MILTLAMFAAAFIFVASDLLRAKSPRTWEDDYDDMVDRYGVANLRPGPHQDATMLERDRLLAERDARNFYRRQPR